MAFIGGLELEAGMADAEILFQSLLQRRLHRPEARPVVVLQHDMAIECHLVLLHLPQVDMVHVAAAPELHHRPDNRIGVHVWRAAEHQDAGGGADQSGRG